MVSSLPRKQQNKLSPDDEILELRAKLATAEASNQRLSDRVDQLILVEHQLYTSQTQLDSQVRIYQKLYELGKALNQTFSPIEVLELANQFVIYQLEFERCLLFLFNPACNLFEVEAFDGYYDEESVALAQSVSLCHDGPIWQRLADDKDYEICTEDCEDAQLCDWRSRLGMDEYIAFALRQESETPLGLLIAGNTAERFAYHPRVNPEAEGFLGLANAASQITTALNSVGFYQALKEERSLLEKRVQDRTQDLNGKNASLQSALEELHLTQAQLVQSEKMSGLGQLVAGIAHEINNPVSFIYGNLSHAQTYTQDLLKLIETYQTCYPTSHPAVSALREEIDLDFLAEDLPQLMDSMRMGATRIEKIVLSLRTFSRMDEADMKSVDIHEGIDSTLLILDHKLNGKLGFPPIEVIKEYGVLPQVECYAGQLNQVFMNILANAADALAEALSAKALPAEDLLTEDLPADTTVAAKAQGKITITTTAHDDFVLVTIADNGPGIPEEIRSNIFNPFFTTKPVGQGTGMGLSISYQIVCDRHGGKLTCESQPGQGTRFLIQIPTSLSI